MTAISCADFPTLTCIVGNARGHHHEYVTVGMRIRELRDGLGWSQAELAGRVGVRTPTIYRYEKDRLTPSAEVAIRLATALGTTAHFLMTGQDAPPAFEDDPATLAEFLGTADGKTVTDDELERLRAMPFKGGSPSVVSYKLALLAIRDALP